jgi:GT2 family glycosyltransferase
MSRSLLQKLRPYYIRKALRYLRHYGVKDFAVRVRERLTPDDVPYGPWLEEHSPDADALAAQRMEDFGGTVRFSVCVPVWNTPEIYFREMADSVLSQTYPHLELVIANASPENKELSSLLKVYEARDSRVKLLSLDKNGGIALNTNAAAAACTGDFICFLDHDDMLAPNALYEAAKALHALGGDSGSVQMIYTDEDKMRFDSHGGREYFQPHFKPDFNLDLLRSNNYICHFLMVRRSLFLETGGIDASFEGAQDYEFVLRGVDRIFGKDLRKPGFHEENPAGRGEKTCSCQAPVFPVLHIPGALYHWRVHDLSTADNPDSKQYAYEAGRRAIGEHLERQDLRAEVTQRKDHGFYRVRYSLEEEPFVSILIPNCEQKETLARCLNAIREKTSYPRYEVLVVENNSRSREILDYYRSIQGKDHVRVIRRKGPFNFAALNNYAAAKARGQFLVFMNNDIELLTKNWLKEMLSVASRTEVGAVGARLFYPDGKIQSAGIALGIGGIAGSLFTGMNGSFGGYMHRAETMQDLSAVTGALMMVRRDAFDEAGGFTEELAVAFNDVDLCLKLRERGLLIVYDPFVRAVHHESVSRGDEYTEEKASRYREEVRYMKEHWKAYYDCGDPFYNPNFSLARWDYTLKN